MQKTRVACKDVCVEVKDTYVSMKQMSDRGQQMGKVKKNIEDACYGVPDKVASEDRKLPYKYIHTTLSKTLWGPLFKMGTKEKQIMDSCAWLESMAGSVRRVFKNPTGYGLDLSACAISLERLEEEMLSKGCSLAPGWTQGSLDQETGIRKVSVYFHPPEKTDTPGDYTRRITPRYTPAKFKQIMANIATTQKTLDRLPPTEEQYQADFARVVLRVDVELMRVDKLPNAYVTPSEVYIVTECFLRTEE